MPQAAVSNRSKPASLFDYLVGTSKQGCRHVEAERPCGRQALIRFTRGLGMARSGDLAGARAEIEAIKALRAADFRGLHRIIDKRAFAAGRSWGALIWSLVEGVKL